MDKKMVFPRQSREQICCDIAKAGLEEGFVVVPEYTLNYKIDDAPPRRKIADLVWLATHGEPNQENGWKFFQVVAAFEIEGFDVQLDTINLHSQVYAQFQQQFSCYVPFYSQASHRHGYGLNSDLIDSHFGERRQKAEELKNVVTVCDGRNREWLRPARESAKAAAEKWLVGLRQP